MGRWTSWAHPVTAAILACAALLGCGGDSEKSGGGGGTGGSGGSGGLGGGAGAPAGCADGTVGGTEQCDDGNGASLDGCDSTCRYELYLRWNAMKIESGPAPAWCDKTANGLGTALTDLALGQVNSGLTDGMANGGTNIILQALGLEDPTGVTDDALELGVTSGKPDPAKGTWPGGDPMDWSFLLDPATLDAAGLPTARLSAELDNRVLTAGPSTIQVALSISGSPALLEILEAQLHGRMGDVAGVPAPPPAELAPGVTVVETMAADQTDEGLCGNVTVDSLAKIAIPKALTEGTTACGDCAGSNKYTYCGDEKPVGPDCNSLLDALVGGCKFLVCFQEAVIPTQPDVTNGSVGALAVEGPLHKVPTAKTDGNQDAYSSYFTFTAKRQHASGKL